MNMAIPRLNPDDYMKLFNLKEDLFTCYYEISERQRMHLEGLPDMELMYIDGQWFFSKKDLENYNLGINKIAEIIEKIKKRSEGFLEFTKKIVRSHEKRSDDELMSDFRGLMKIYRYTLRPFDSFVYCEHHLNKRIVDILRKNNLDETYIDILFTPLYESYNKKRHKDYILLKLNKITKEEFIRKWAWSYYTVFLAKELTDDIIKDNLDHIKEPEKELEEIEEEEKEQKQKYKEFYDKLSPELKQLADIIQRMIFIRDYRIENLFRGNYNSAGLLRELAKRLGLSYDELVHMTPAEVMEKKIPSDLQKRIKRYCMIKDRIYTGKNADEIYGLFNKRTGFNSVKGTPAFPGFVKGTARIITSPRDLPKLNKGEILVCDITTPDYLIAIKKAAAIVSNIGGITCHSAVVAREFRIPCIVGTNNATTTFEDGEEIEVDANKGVVRKIK